MIHIFLASESFKLVVRMFKFLPSYRSDHSLVTMSIKLNEFKKKVRSIWKFNNSLHKDRKYVEVVKKVIKKIK